MVAARYLPGRGFFEKTSYAAALISRQSTLNESAHIFVAPITNSPKPMTFAKSLIDRWEFIRFIVSGLLATGANLATVWVCLSFVGFEIALVFGIFAGIVSSFLLMKLFAFRARRWNRASGEVVRFLLVYSVGLALYYGVAYVSGVYILPTVLPTPMAQIIGAAVGAGTMMLSSYAGHRFFTYQNTQS